MRDLIECVGCYFVFGSPFPGFAEEAKGRGVYTLKRIASWVKTVVRQVCFYLYGVLEIEGKLGVLRKEKLDDATGLWVIWQGKPSSYAFFDNY